MIKHCQVKYFVLMVFPHPMKQKETEEVAPRPKSKKCYLQSLKQDTLNVPLAGLLVHKGLVKNQLVIAAAVSSSQLFNLVNLPAKVVKSDSRGKTAETNDPFQPEQRPGSSRTWQHANLACLGSCSNSFDPLPAWQHLHSWTESNL